MSDEQTGSEMTNIDWFNRLVGMLFAEMYSSFPVPIDADHDRILPSIGAKEGGIAHEWDIYKPLVFPGDKDRDAITFFRATWQWLLDEKLIVGDRNHATLASRTLSLLNSVPSSVLEHKTLGVQIGEAAKDMGQDITKDVAKTQLGELVGTVLGGFAKSMMGG
jgi:hypothetical protein